MVFVDIQAPALDGVYDFSLADDVPIHLLIEEIVEMICRREKLSEAPEEGSHWLCSTTGGVIFDGQHTLRDYGVQTGWRLMIV